MVTVLEFLEPSDEEIRKILPHHLLIFAFKKMVEGEKGAKVGITHPDMINHSDAESFLPALVLISQWGLDQALSINFLTNGVLPPADSSDFPELALGLILILDQAPRFNFSGVDSRYTFDYFGPLALKLVTQLRNLPPHLVPWNRDRWLENGYSVEQWLWGLLWFLAPITHSELLGNHTY